MKPVLKLEKISKVYTSSKTVAIGLKDINLDFYMGEFVTITGSSGSGKTTLLNVLSGMDSYEEGELFFNGESTSYYSQQDWEKYRMENISFVFQDYNIIDSFTVLENVEFALLHIEDPKKRRKKAIELIEKVGLKSHINHKGSKLSGGQKQRTVIARALAKESPIILADEPTGNLDTKSAAEIVKLLKKIALDKLVIVVTHNAEQFKDVATREIRLYDGKVASDIELNNHETTEYKKIELPKMRSEFLSGCQLGLKRFKAKPKLTTFIVLMLFISIFTSFVVCSSENYDLGLRQNIFRDMDGRVIVTKKDGTTINNSDLDKIPGIIDYYLDDNVLDNTNVSVVLYDPFKYTITEIDFSYNYGYKGKIKKGRLPEKDFEVFLTIPKAYEDIFEKFLNKEITIGNFSCLLVGYSTYINNSQNANIYFTKEGLKIVSINNTLGKVSSSFVDLTAAEDGVNCEPLWVTNYTIKVDQTLSKGEVVVPHDITIPDGASQITVKYNNKSLVLSFDKINSKSIQSINISVEDAIELYNNNFDIFNNTQASIFYKNNNEAKKHLSELSSLGYFAVMSNSTQKNNNILSVLAPLFSIIGLVILLLFIVLFMNICTKRSIESMKKDIAIFRSMGINKSVIIISTYFEMILSGLIAYSSLLPLYFIFFYTKLSLHFYYLPVQYYLIAFLSVMFIVVLLSYKFNKKLFNESVRKNLRRRDS